MQMNRIAFRKICKQFIDYFIEENDGVYKKEQVHWEMNWEYYDFFVNDERVFSFMCYPSKYIIEVQSNDGDVDEKFILKTWNQFSSFLENQNVHFLVRNRLVEKVEHIGEKGKEIYEILKPISDLYYNMTDEYIEIDFELFPVFYLWIDLQEKPKITCGLNLYNMIEEWCTKEEFVDFLTRIKNEEKRMKSIEYKMIGIAQKYDPSAYFHEEEQKLYVFGEEFYANMTRQFEEDQDLYYYHIESAIGDYEADEFEETVSLFKQELEPYLKKERILRATRGEMVNVLPRFFYELFQDDSPAFNFVFYVESDVDEQKLNAYLLSLKNWKISPYKKGYKVGELYVYEIGKTIKIEKEKSLV